MPSESSADPAELERLLDAISYELTSARAAGLRRPDQMRAALKRARDLVADADSLVSSVIAKRAEE